MLLAVFPNLLIHRISNLLCANFDEPFMKLLSAVVASLQDGHIRLKEIPHSLEIIGYLNHLEFA